MVLIQARPPAPAFQRKTIPRAPPEPLPSRKSWVQAGLTDPSPAGPVLERPLWLRFAIEGDQAEEKRWAHRLLQGEESLEVAAFAPAGPLLAPWGTSSSWHWGPLRPITVLLVGGLQPKRCKAVLWGAHLQEPGGTGLTWAADRTPSCAKDRQRCSEILLPGRAGQGQEPERFPDPELPPLPPWPKTSLPPQFHPKRRFQAAQQRTFPQRLRGGGGPDATHSPLSAFFQFHHHEEEAPLRPSLCQVGETPETVPGPPAPPQGEEEKPAPPGTLAPPPLGPVGCQCPQALADGHPQ